MEVTAGCRSSPRSGKNYFDTQCMVTLKQEEAGGKAQILTLKWDQYHCQERMWEGVREKAELD
jgi:hypothetical protein